MARTDNLEPIQSATLNQDDVLLLIRTMSRSADVESKRFTDRERYTALLERLINSQEIKIEWRPRS